MEYFLLIPPRYHKRRCWREACSFIFSWIKNNTEEKFEFCNFFVLLCPIQCFQCVRNSLKSIICSGSLIKTHHIMLLNASCWKKCFHLPSSSQINTKNRIRNFFRKSRLSIMGFDQLNFEFCLLALQIFYHDLPIQFPLHRNPENHTPFPASSVYFGICWIRLPGLFVFGDDLHLRYPRRVHSG